MERNETKKMKDREIKIEIDGHQSFKDMLEKFLGLKNYQYIMENVHKVNMSDANNEDTRQFRTTYNRFYNVRHKNWKVWRENYYQVFEKMKHEENNATFERILNEISIETVHASFASKMLATLKPNKPILDSRVLNNLEITIKGNTKQEKIKSSIEAYKKIEAFYNTYLPTEDAKKNIALFNQIFPDYLLINDTKKIDFIIWGYKKNSSTNKK